MQQSFATPATQGPENGENIDFFFSTKPGRNFLIKSTQKASAPTRLFSLLMGRVAQSVGHLTRKSGVLGSIPGLATYFRFSFRFFKKGSCQLLAKVCARSTG